MLQVQDKDRASKGGGDEKHRTIYVNLSNKSEPNSQNNKGGRELLFGQQKKSHLNMGQQMVGVKNGDQEQLYIVRS